MGFELSDISNSVNPRVQVVLSVSSFRPLHPLPLDRCSTRPISTEIPNSLSVLSGVKPWIMVKTKRGKPFRLYYLRQSLCNSMVFTSPLVSRLCSRSWNYGSGHSPHYVCHLARHQSSNLVQPLESNPEPLW